MTRTAMLLITSGFTLIISLVLGYLLSSYYSVDTPMVINIVSILAYSNFAVIAISPIIYIQMLQFWAQIANEVHNLNSNQEIKEKILEFGNASRKLLDSIYINLRDFLATAIILFIIAIITLAGINVLPDFAIFTLTIFIDASFILLVCLQLVQDVGKLFKSYQLYSSRRAGVLKNNLWQRL